MLAFCLRVPPSHPATQMGPDRRLWASTGQEGNDPPLLSKQSQNKSSNWSIQTLLAHKMYKHFLVWLKISKNTYSFRSVLELAALPAGTINNPSIVWRRGAWSYCDPQRKGQRLLGDRSQPGGARHAPPPGGCSASPATGPLGDCRLSQLFRNFKSSLISKFIPLFIHTKEQQAQTPKEIMFSKKNFYRK